MVFTAARENYHNSPLRTGQDQPGHDNTGCCCGDVPIAEGLPGDETSPLQEHLVERFLTPTRGAYATVTTRRWTRQIKDLLREPRHGNETLLAIAVFRPWFDSSLTACLRPYVRNHWIHLYLPILRKMSDAQSLPPPNPEETNAESRCAMPRFRPGGSLRESSPSRQENGAHTAPVAATSARATPPPVDRNRHQERPAQPDSLSSEFHSLLYFIFDQSSIS